MVNDLTYSNDFELPDKNQPSFYRFPQQSNRTGWQPVQTPTILVVPWSYDSFGNYIQDAEIQEVTFSIEETSVARVAGHDHIGVYNPDLNIYKIIFNNGQSVDSKIGRYEKLNDYISESIITDETDVHTLKSGINGKLEIYANTIYYDFSDVEIETVDLKHGWYNFIWTAKYYKRIIKDGILVCIDKSQLQEIRLIYPINHPGDIHAEMQKRTPSFYFDNTKEDKDTVLQFYRPLADTLQDVFDEQTFIRGINWLYTMPAQYLPYLAYLIGVDLPFYNNISKEDNDKIRRRMLKRGAELQRLKGSKLCITELFKVLGFTAEIIKLWSSNDGKRFIAPNEKLPSEYKNLEVTSVDVLQTDPVINDYQIDGFGEIEIPLLYKNNYDKIEVNAFLINKSNNNIETEAYVKFKSIITNSVENYDYLVDELLTKDQNDNYIPCKLFGDITGLSEESRCSLYTDTGYCHRNISKFPDGIIAWDNFVVSDIELFSEEHYGFGVLNPETTELRRTQTNIKYNKKLHNLSINFTKYAEFNNDNTSLFVFVTYLRDKITVPSELSNPKDLRSNRFDVLIKAMDSNLLDSNAYDYVINALFKHKAFHSLLRKISIEYEFEDVYNVSDFCVDGFISPNVSNIIQVPPPVYPDYTYCSEDNGLKSEDINLRNRIINALKEEYNAWVRVHHDSDGNLTHNIPEDKRQKLQSLSNITFEEEDFDGLYNYLGQDRHTYNMVLSRDTSYQLSEIIVGDNWIIGEGHIGIATTYEVLPNINIDDEIVLYVTSINPLTFMCEIDNVTSKFTIYNLNHIKTPEFKVGHIIKTKLRYILYNKQYYFELDTSALIQIKPQCNDGTIDGTIVDGDITVGQYDFVVSAVSDTTNIIATVGGSIIFDNSLYSKMFVGQEISVTISEVIGESVKFEFSDRWAATEQIDTKSKVLDPDALPVLDYCYTGRVKDQIDINIPVITNDIIRNKPCSVGLGDGYYYEDDNNLYYTNEDYLNHINVCSHDFKSMDIEGPALGFPGHRNVSVDHLENDLNVTDLVNENLKFKYKMRPWDYNINECDCPINFNPLNARIDTIYVTIYCDNEQLESQQLVFDEVDLVYAGDGIEPDILPNGIGTISSQTLTHRLYSTFANNLYDEDSYPIDFTSDEIITITDPIYSTANLCNGGNYVDFSDGYPSSIGQFNYDLTGHLETRECSNGDKIIESDIEAEILFNPIRSFAATCDSMIREAGVIIDRMNCKCIKAGCDGYELVVGEDWTIGVDIESASSECLISKYNNRDGTIDFDNDKLEIDQIIDISDDLPSEVITLDGKTDASTGITDPTDVQHIGQYGELYHYYSTVDGDTLTAITETFMPSVWMQDPDGYREKHKIYKRGVYTITTVTYSGYASGELIKIAEDFDQYITFKQVNLTCCDQCEDPNQVICKEDINRFRYVCDHYLVDDLEILVDCNNGWVEPDGDSYWISPGESNPDTFEFINVWGNDAVESDYYETYKLGFVGTSSIIDEEVECFNLNNCSSKPSCFKKVGGSLVPIINDTCPDCSGD